jgi:hypothetical protein
MEVERVLCAATRNGFTCTIEQHEGEHQAWSEHDLCASWTDDGRLHVFAEGDVGAMSEYIESVLTNSASDEIQLVS